MGTQRGWSVVQDYGENSNSCGYCKSGSPTSVSHDLIDQGWRRSGRYMYKPNLVDSCCPLYTIRMEATQFAPTKAQRKLLRKWERYLAGQLEPQEQCQMDEDDNSWEAQGAGSHDPHGPQGVHMPGDPHMPHDAMTGLQPPQPGGHSPHEPAVSDHRPQTSAAQQGAAGGSGSRSQGAAAQQACSHAGEAPVVHPRGQNGNHTGDAAAPPGQPQAPAASTSAQPGERGAVASHEQGVLQSLLAAVQRCVPSEVLQQVAVRVERAAERLRKRLPPGTAFTSPCALALGAAAKKLGLSLPAPNLAEQLAAAFNSSLQPQGAAYQAVAAAGHINFVANEPTTSSEGRPQLPVPQHGQPPCSASTASQQTPASGQHDRGAGGRRRQPPAPAAEPPAVDGGAAASTSGRHHLELRLVPSSFLEDEYQLYKKYQMRQHGDKEFKLTRDSYRHFLVDSPLAPVSRLQDPSAPACGYGSFHQQYWLDGRLIAVGVVDILPRCLSSKYFFWDVDFAFLAPGRFSALKEIEWVQAASASSPQLRYYYMGFYLASCQKMRYKADFLPSDLLCPEKRVWVRLTDEVKRCIDERSYVVLSQLPQAQTFPNVAVPTSPSSGLPVHMDMAALQELLEKVELLKVIGGRTYSFTLKQALERQLLGAQSMDVLRSSLVEWCTQVGASAANIKYLAHS